MSAPAILSDCFGAGALSLNSFMLQPGQETIMADKIYELLKAHSA